jgi:hypothetical protein
MSWLYSILEKQKQFWENFSIREHFCAVFKTSFSFFFWYLATVSEETCWSSPFLHFELSGDTFLALMAADPAFMQSWKKHRKPCFISAGKSQRHHEMWFLSLRHGRMIGEKWNSPVTVLHWEPVPWAMCYFNSSSFWTRSKINPNSKGKNVLFFPSGV